MDLPFIPVPPGAGSAHTSRRRFRILLALEVLVVFLTTYLLIIPAITWEKSLICELEEHTHTEACFAADGTLLCGKEAHTHTDSCYDAPPAQFNPYGCGYEAHTHSDACYDETGVLLCTIPAHTHTDRCLKQSSVSQPTVSLFASSLGATSGTAIGSASDFSQLAAGGSYYLSKDITVSSGVTINGANTILDLNGHYIAVTGSLFTVNSGSLTIRNLVSSVQEETEVMEGDDVSMWANTASYSGGTLTYYVTEPTIVDDSIGKTEETLKKITVRKGIIAGNQNGRFAQMDGGTLILEGGYLCNFKSTGSDDGGAIYMSSGTLYLKGAVLAGNIANNHGGAIYMSGSGAKAEMTGGILSGNVAYWEGGGAVYATDSASFTLNGGYITNNSATSMTYEHGGGGILLNFGTWLYFNGGYITGNQGGGGGVKTLQNSDNRRSGSVEMTGGFITANHSTNAEGGGMNINARGYLHLTGGYFTNNIAGNGKNDKDFPHWGGGGLFCSENSATIYIESALITNNSAGGFGGGVAGCSTGQISVSPENGLAVFGNEALGIHPSGGESTKNEDHYLAFESPVFMSNGYQDYFCSLGSTVVGSMLGGGNALWTGSSDGRPVRTMNKDEIITGASVTGLTSEASQTDRAAAMSAAKVFFCGNESPTHGGGILANGYLVFGTTTEFTNYARVTLKGKKLLYGTDGAQKALPKGAFRFLLTDETGKVLYALENEEGGTLPLERILTFTEPGTFRYYLREDPSMESKYPGLQMDGMVYRIDVQTEEVEQGTVPWTNFTLTRIVYKSVTVTNETTGVTLYSGKPEPDEYSAAEIAESLDFENREVKLPAGMTMSFTVTKNWEGGVPKVSNLSVRVQLLSDGVPYGDEVTLNAKNSWKTTWNALSDEHTYTVRETYCSVSGYYPTVSYTYSQTFSETDGPSNEAFLYVLSGSYFVPVTGSPSLSASAEYLIAYPEAGKILKITSGHTDAALNASDTYSLSLQEGTLKIGTVTYSKWYAADQVPQDCRFIVQTAHAGDNSNFESYDRIVFKNRAVDSWLLSQEKDGVYLKGTNAIGWSSAVKVENGHLKIQWEWSQNNGWRYIIWNGSGFDIADTLSHVKIRTVTSSTRTAVLTNRKSSSRTFTLGITKADQFLPTRILPGASFTLTKEGETVPMTFTFDAIHDRYIPETGSNADAQLVTSVNGQLTVSGLSAGTYTLTETIAPPGYQISPPITVILGDDTPEGILMLDIPDSPAESHMPDTGGVGPILFCFPGALLIALSGTALLLRGRKHNERRTRRP